MFGLDSGVNPDVTLVEPIECEGVFEYPMTVFDGGTHSLRHAQVTACSYREMEGLLWQALEAGRKAFVILSHNFELLNSSMNRPDDIVVARFRKLCSFLDRNRDCFHVRGFHGLTPTSVFSQPAPLTSPIWKTGLRMLEQGYTAGVSLNQIWHYHQVPMKLQLGRQDITAPKLWLQVREVGLMMKLLLWRNRYRQLIFFKRIARAF